MDITYYCGDLRDENGANDRIMFEVLKDFHPLLLIGLTIDEGPAADRQTDTHARIHSGLAQ